MADPMGFPSRTLSYSKHIESPSPGILCPITRHRLGSTVRKK